MEADRSYGAIEREALDRLASSRTQREVFETLDDTARRFGGRVNIYAFPPRATVYSSSTIPNVFSGDPDSAIPDHPLDGTHVGYAAKHPTSEPLYSPDVRSDGPEQIVVKFRLAGPNDHTRSSLTVPVGTGDGGLLVCQVVSHDLNAFEAPKRAALTHVVHGAAAKLQGGLAAWKYGIVSQDMQMITLVERAERIGKSGMPVLITGESGTGKELFANLIAGMTAGEGLYVKVNCATIPEHLAESTLFGHERGSFTGAHCQKIGLVERANGGDFFIDEIGELHPAVQPKLLRFLEDGTFERLGGTRTLKSKLRVIAATKRNLLEAVDKGQFRDDLFYRLDKAVLRIPPLRERPGDVSLIAKVTVEHLAAQHGYRRLSQEALEHLERYSWPGNVRQLVGKLENAVQILTDPGETLTASHFDLPDVPTAARDTQAGLCTFPELLSSQQEQTKQWCLKLQNSNLTIEDACEKYGIKQDRFYDMLQKVGLTPNRRLRSRA